MKTKHAIGAASYLNTTPLVWGMLHGPQRDEANLTFSIPSVCAEEVEAGKTEIGLVPVAEIARQGLEIVPGVGIAAVGAVRSILLFSKLPWRQVQTLAADASSRTSVELARVILRERFGVLPQLLRFEPNLDRMMAHCDAALVIGDPALRIDPEQQPYGWLDLAAEWIELTQLPMVFAAWAGKPGIPVEPLRTITMDSYAYGAGRIEEIARQEHAKRLISLELATHYLRSHIHFELGEREMRGLETFFQMAGLMAFKA